MNAAYVRRHETVGKHPLTEAPAVNGRGQEIVALDTWGGHGRRAGWMEEGRLLTLTPGDAQLRHLDHAWASTVHAFQGRTVDNVIAAMEANHPHLTTAKSFYVGISRARDRAELVTDDAQALKERLEAVTGERLSALEGIGEAVQPGRERDGTNCEITAPSSPDRNIEPEPSRDKAPAPKPPIREKRIDLDMGL